MSNSPNYSLRKSPQFSVNHLTDYLSTSGAPQRETVIRRAKFPRKPSLIAYQQASTEIGRFLSGDTSDLASFDPALERLKAKARREMGYNRDEALRCIAAIEEFRKTFRKHRASRHRYADGQHDVPMTIGGVRINVRLHSSIIEEAPDGQTYCGGCVLFLANSDDVRKGIEARRRQVASMIHWALEETQRNMEPLPRLCMSIDPFGGTIVKASAANERFRHAVTLSCQEAADWWDRVEPPDGYDGPAWR